MSPAITAFTRIVIGKHHPSPSAVTEHDPDITVNPAMLIGSPSFPPRPRGWHSFVLPVPPRASRSASPLVDVALADGVTSVPTVPPLGGGVGVGGDEEASAATTHDLETITAIVRFPTMTPPAVLPPPGTAAYGLIVCAGSSPALLPMAMMDDDASVSDSNGGRNRLSRFTLGITCIAGCSLPPPTAVEGRAALLSDSRPAAGANRRVVTVHPRPGPASLLTSLPRPQPGRVTTLAGRAGDASRASGTGVSSRVICGLGLIDGTATARKMTTQAILNSVHDGAPPVGPRG